MPFHPEYFSNKPRYTLQAYLEHLKDNGLCLNVKDSKTYLSWYEADLNWIKNQKPKSRQQDTALGFALDVVKSLTDKGVKQMLKKIIDSKKSTTVSTYINSNNTITGNFVSLSHTSHPEAAAAAATTTTTTTTAAAAASTSSNDIQQQAPQTTNKRKSECVEQLQKRQQQRQDDDEYPPPSPDDRYLVGDFDASQAFYDFQLSIASHDTEFYLESNLHHVLAASSILFVTPNRMPDDLVNVFGGEQQMDSFIDNLQSKIDINSRRNSRLPMKLISHLTSIVEDVLAGIKSRNQGICSLLSMEGKVFTTDGELIVLEEEEIPVPGRVTDQHFRYIKSVANLLDKLPNKVIMEDIKEHELCTRYLDPVLCGFFDNPSESVFFRWTDHLNLESKKSALVSKRRPDSCLTRLNGVKWGATLAYGEVKCAGASDHLYDICKDTLRIGIFCKNALDVGKMKGILGIQAVGRTITFYLMNLLSDGLYTMLELTSITIPGSIDDLLKYLMELSKVLLVLDVCDNWCTPVDSDQIQLQTLRHRPTLSTPSFCRIVSSTTCRSRQSVMKSYYN